MPTTADEQAENDDDRTFPEELERLKDTREGPAPRDETHEFALDGVNYRAHATFRSIPQGKDDGAEPEFGRGHLEIRIGFEDCPTPRGYIADVLDAMNALPREKNAPATLPDDFTTDAERAKEGQSAIKDALDHLEDQRPDLAADRLESALED